ncbi:sensor histidine kinase [Nitrincola alkalisediminis]|uniref:sensor histidine kinase n=1 Tax=Nitrincola alkalisediminis TaxID=1366656 RepID=UPI0018735232|nr:ATP-binding protein [Nitrincola alkalisediminis]
MLNYSKHRTFNISLTKKFLLGVIPLLVVVMLVATSLLVVYENKQAKRLEAQYVQQRVDTLARQLAEPVWQLAHNVTANILTASLEDKGTLCIVLEHVSGIVLNAQPLTIGNCGSAVLDVRVFHSPVHYEGLGEARRVADLYLHYRPQTGNFIAHLMQSIKGLMLILITGVLTLVIITTALFRWIIFRPLEQVSNSLKFYQSTGVRHPVDWSSNDELGLLIKDYNNTLSLQVKTEEDLAKARDEAHIALENLKNLQNQLVQTEKLASLGKMVAGIAHEVNTPLGNAKTISTSLDIKLQNFDALIKAGGLKKSSLEEFICEFKDGLRIMSSSLQMAVKQVNSFKQVAVDQTSMLSREFNLKTVVDEILSTLKPRLKHLNVQLDVDIPENFTLFSYPGPLGQIILNAVNNSLTHGFEHQSQGVIYVKAYTDDAQTLVLIIGDNGCGVAPESIDKLFDPFYTTKFGKGGSGLGLYIVYSLVTKILKGSIIIRNNPGLEMEIRMPFQVSSVETVIVSSEKQ